jgi:hypothetical protein
MGRAMIMRSVVTSTTVVYTIAITLPRTSIGFAHCPAMSLVSVELREGTSVAGRRPGDGTLTKFEVRARRMASPNARNPTADIRTRNKSHSNPPQPSISRQIFEEAVIHSQEARFDAPDDCEEDQNDRKLVFQVEVALIQQLSSLRHPPRRDPDQVVYGMCLNRLKDGVGEEECKGEEEPVVIGV